MAQSDTDALFQRAVEKEHAGQMDAAYLDYKRVLVQRPDSHDALLGIARVARARYQLDEASHIYQDMLRANPADIDAVNGMGWIALTEYRVDEARSSFERVLALQPTNQEALAGVAASQKTYRYRLDVSGGPFNNNKGTAWAAGVNLGVELDASNAVEIGFRRNSRELASANPLDVTTLPADIWSLGYRWQIPGSVGLALGYENRARSHYATEHRVNVQVTASVTTDVQVFGGVQAGFGSGWNSRTASVGSAVKLGGPWQGVATVYAQSQPNTVQVLVLDLVRQGEQGGMLLVGVSGSGASSTVARTADVHARLVYPLTQDSALLLTARRSSFNQESQLEFGWRKYWN